MPARSRPPAILVGVSYGGWVAVRYAARSPSRVRALVVASAPGPPSAPPALARWVASAPVVAGVRADLARPAVARGRAARFRGGALLRFRAAQLLRVCGADVGAARRGAPASGVRHDFGEVAPRVAAPTLRRHRRGRARSGSCPPGARARTPSYSRRIARPARAHRPHGHDDAAPSLRRPRRAHSWRVPARDRVRHGRRRGGEMTARRAASRCGWTSPRARRGLSPWSRRRTRLGGTMQDRVVHHATLGLHRLGCVVWRLQLSRRRHEPGLVRPASGERDDLRAVIDAAAARTRMPVWAVGYSFGSWIAIDVGAADPRVSALVAIAPPVNGYDFDASAQRQAEVPHPRRARRTEPAQGGPAVLRTLRSRASWSSSTAPTTCSTDSASEIADTIGRLLRGCAGGCLMDEAVIVSAVRTPVARRRPARCVPRVPTTLQRRRLPARSRARPALDPAQIDDVILGCAMPEAEQGLNVARIASLRAGIPHTASAVTVNRFCSVRPAGDCPRRRAHPCRRAPRPSSPAAPSR